MEPSFTILSECSSECEQNINFEHDFDINKPIEFSLNHKISKDELNKYYSALELLEFPNPDLKLNIKKYEAIKKRIRSDFKRIKHALHNVGKNNLEEILFVSIGNSMESYGFMLNVIFPYQNIGHIKVSRTLKDNVEKFIGKEKRQKVFEEYFSQKINEIYKKNQNIKTIVILDTFGAGETSSTILAPFVKKGIPEKEIYVFCFMEGGHIKPTPPYDENIKIVHFSEVEKLSKKMAGFITKTNPKMPVLAINQYYKLDVIKNAITNFKNQEKSNNENAKELILKYSLKKLKIFTEVQKTKIEKGEFIIIPSQTTRLLRPINPYFLVAQKTVFIAKDNINGNFITRDGFGISRTEIPPMILHILNIKQHFHKLDIIDKLKLSLEQYKNKEFEWLKYAFDSYIRKKIIYHKISEFESITNS